MIGVFDSGIGGLTVLKALIAEFPDQSFTYIGDSAHLPYGNKTPETIRAYGEKILNHLVEQKLKALVIACNSASSVFSETEWQGLPLINVIQPGALTAIQKSNTKRIGVIGTRATIHSHAYAHEILKLDPSAKIFEQACPLLVPLAEEGWTDDPVTNLIVFRYLQPLIQESVDTLVLGCTHYPLLRTSIQKVMGNPVSLVESGEAVCRTLRQRLHMTVADSTPEVKIFSTDYSEQFQRMTHRVLQGISLQTIAEIQL